VLISHRLYRNSCQPSCGIYIKDLDKLGRDIRKTLIVDNIAENFDMQPDNGIHIISWYNDPRDSELQKLEPILKSLVRQRIFDVREFLRVAFNRRQPATPMSYGVVERSPVRRGSPGKRGSLAPHQAPPQSQGSNAAFTPLTRINAIINGSYALQ